MLARLSLLILVIFMLPNVSNALIVSGGLGLGSTSMKNEAKETEGPFTETFTVEKLFHSKLAMGVEHLRSLTPKLISSASFTGLLARFYVNAAPVSIVPPEEMGADTMITHDYCVFYGTGVGNAQSSRLPNDQDLSSNSAGIYVSPRAGVDYQLSRHVGVRGEFIYATTVFGKGNITLMTLGGSIYWMF